MLSKKIIAFLLLCFLMVGSQIMGGKKPPGISNNLPKVPIKDIPQVGYFYMGRGCSLLMVLIH